MGNSITAAWAPMFPALFPGKPYIGRGISGQTTPQMLVRFRQDVIALKPAVVVILGGTNDIAGNTGPSTLEPAPKIVALNAWVRAYAASHGHAYADFHGAMADARQGLPPELASDGVHPTEAGYRVMGRLVERAIAEALNRRRHRPQ